MSSFTAILAGLLVISSIAIAWLLGKRKDPMDTGLINELRQQSEKRASEIATLQIRLTEMSNSYASAQARLEQHEKSRLENQEAQIALNSELSDIRLKLAGNQNALATAEAQLKAEQLSSARISQNLKDSLEVSARQQVDMLSLKSANAELASKVNSLEERRTVERQQIVDIQDKFQKEFEAISNKLLVENSSKFNKQSSESLAHLLTPIKDELKDFKSKLELSQKETATHSALLKDEIARIGKEAANLSKALKGDVKILGNWGENMLDQILDKSGLQLGIHYNRQRSIKDDEGNQRYLDVIIELPDKKHLVIDSKVSLKSYEDYTNGTDEVLRLIKLQNHVDSIRNHFRGLDSKRYQDTRGINTTDFVLMYIPIEAAFFAALTAEPGLFGEALDKNVVLITNSTLLATLRTVANVWRLADQQKNTVAIADRGAILYDKFVGFIDDLQNVGKALKHSQEAWEAATNKLHTGNGNLVGQAEKLKSLGIKTKQSIPKDLIIKATDAEDSQQLPPMV